VDIVTIAIAAVVAGADSFTEIEDFARAKADWPGSFLELPKGIPSHDTYNRVFSKLLPSRWQACFLSWVRQTLNHSLNQEHIAIDGKQMNGSGAKGYSAVHQVSAWATRRGLALAQLAVEEKGNEITVLPDLIETLDLFDLEGCTVSVDAMGTQREVARLLEDKQAQYLQALKDNQPKLAEDVRWLFEDAGQNWTTRMDFAQSQETAHGREEIRRCWVIAEVDYLQAHQWPGLKAVALVESQRTELARNKTSMEQRYFLLNYTPTAGQALQDIRNHWKVENQLHWVLDVVFNEDLHSLSKDFAPQNFNILRQLALNLIKLDPSKGSIKLKRKRAAWDLPFLQSLLLNLKPLDFA
jgi:predicted transposase YbfD/YdcC